VTSGTTMRSGWPALALTVSARAVLALLLGLLAAALAPAVFGWHPSVVMSGSMRPRLVPGDVVVARPVDPAVIAVGQILLVDSPDHAGQLRLHRVVAVAANRKLILRGDANARPDSTPVARSAVRGVAALRVPWVGRPFRWAHTGRLVPSALTALGLLVVTGCAFWWRPAADEAATDDTPPPPRSAPPPAVGVMLRRALLVGLTTVLVVAATAGGAVAIAFTRRTTNSTNTWAASAFFTCTNAARAGAPSFLLPLSDPAGPAAVDLSGNAANGTYNNRGVTYGVPGPCRHDNRTAVAMDGSDGYVTAGGASFGTGFTAEVWFKAANCASTHGGQLLSVLSPQNKVIFAVAITRLSQVTYAVGARTNVVTTTGTYCDNSWHLAVATLGAAGLALYLDNAAPLTSSAATSISGAGSYILIGSGHNSDLNTGDTDLLTGSLAFAATYNYALTPAQVSAHYNAAS
jgi:signal peptidase I